MLKLIIFDLDGVLVETETLASQAISKLLLENGYSLSVEDISTRFCGKIGKDIYAEIHKEAPHISPDLYIESDLRIAEKIKHEIEHIPFANETLASLAEQNFPFVIASNSTPKQIEKSLHLTNLHAYFEPNSFFSGQSVKKPKPFPDLHRQILNRFKLEPQNALVVEDSLTGAQAAKSTGIPFLGFTGAGHLDPRKQNQALKNLGALEVFENHRDLKGFLNQRIQDSTKLK